MKELIKKVMTWNKYPNQNPAWEGWEYVAKTNKQLTELAKILDYDTDGGIYQPTTGCLQIDGDRFVIEIDGYVWEATEKEFISILNKLDEKGKSK